MKIAPQAQIFVVCLVPIFQDKNGVPAAQVDTAPQETLGHSVRLINKELHTVLRYC